MSIINKEFFEDWVKGTRASHGDDPTEWDGNNRKCNLCEKDAENMDEYCEDHQPCIVCGENDDCECECELSLITACCESRFWGETDICSECKEHADSAWADELEMSNKGR
tara:strand:- start:46 stop:375 length:330 start_codon:yes stop_codon:yes gene_type:complete